MELNHRRECIGRFLGVFSLYNGTLHVAIDHLRSTAELHEHKLFARLGVKHSISQPFNPFSGHRDFVYLKRAQSPTRKRTTCFKRILKWPKCCVCNVYPATTGAVSVSMSNISTTLSGRLGHGPCWLGPKMSNQP